MKLLPAVKNAKQLPRYTVENFRRLDLRTTPGDWVELDLLNGWVDSGFASVPSCRKEGDLVRVRGIIRNGTITTGTIIFVLPEGYRPLLPEWFSGDQSGANPPAQIRVNETGDVTINKVVSSSHLVLSSLVFSTS